MTDHQQVSPVERISDALQESERRFSAIVSSIPGLVFQMHMTPDQQLIFTYLSEGCEALLGMPSPTLLNHSSVLLDIIEPYSRQLLQDKLRHSARHLTRLDWEGKLWIAAWQDMKWVNIRASVRAVTNGNIQWDGIMLNISQSKQEKLEIEQARKDLQALTAHLNQVKEQERVSIAREIHDDLGGNLTAIKFGLSTIIQQIEAGKSVNLEQTSLLQSIIDQTFDAVHRISGNLRPNILDLGLVDALEWQVNQFRKQLGIEASYITNCQDLTLDADTSMAMFRICQEALSNIAKYAQATQVNVSLQCHASLLTMRIIDNGIGISPADKIKANSFGLRGMQERATAIGGDLRISNTESSTGTMIEVCISITQR